MIIKRAKTAPIGSTIQHAGQTAPEGYLICGQAVSRSTYADLFAVIGTKYGVGDGVSTFDLPPVYNFIYNTLAGGTVGETGGSNTHNHTVGGTAITVAQLPSTLIDLPQKTQTTTINAGYGTQFAAAESGNPASQVALGSGQTHTHTNSVESSLPPFVKMLLCIKYR